jgi:formylglycine-generating enzyme required for sulfatase activity
MHRAILACLGVVLAVLACTPSAFAAKPEAEAEPKPGEEFQDCDTCPKMVVVLAGSFTMGSPPGEKEREPQAVIGTNRASVGSCLCLQVRESPCLSCQGHEQH